MLRNHFLLNTFLSQDSFFSDLHSLTYTYILFTSKGVCFSAGGLAIETARRAAAKSDTPLKWKITRAQIYPSWITAPCSFISYAATQIVGKKSPLLCQRASDVITSSVDITQKLALSTVLEIASCCRHWVRPSVDTQSHTWLWDYI